MPLMSEDEYQAAKKRKKKRPIDKYTESGWLARQKREREQRIKDAMSEAGHNRAGRYDK